MKKLVGLFASVALMTSGAALAFDAQDQQTDTSMQQSGQGGSGSQTGSQMGGSQMGGSQMGSQMGSQAAMGGNEVKGQVIKSDKKTVYLKGTDGAVVQLKLDNKTQFSDPTLKSAKDLKEGTEIRANFDVKGTDNIATSIQPSSGMGGSGDVLSPDSGINQGGSMQNDTGGSGSMDQGLDQGGSGMDQSGSDVDKSGQDIGGEKNY